jgi:proliferating cell nuclear antigen PCNA
MNLQTSNGACFRTLIKCLKDILTETTIVFNSKGMSITTMDKLKKSLVDVFLPSENFDSYDCNTEFIKFGIDVFQLHQCINSIEQDDTLSLSCNNGIVHHLTIKFENSKRSKTHTLKLIEPEVDTYDVPDVDYDVIARIPSIDIKKSLKSLHDDVVEITSLQESITINTSGTYTSTSTELKGIDFKKLSHERVQNCYSLKALNSFIKCTALSEVCEIHLSAELPLMVKYNVETMGTVRLCLKALPKAPPPI